MLDAYLNVLLVIAGIFVALLAIPLFTPAGRRERGFIYGAELALVFFAWYKIRGASALLMGETVWMPRQVDQLRTLLLVVAGVTALFLLYQFIPWKKSADTADEQ